MQFRFGEFVLDTRSGDLVGPDGPVTLRRQTFRLLEVLLDNAPELIEHDRLLDEAWGRSALSTNVVPQAISELRGALGDSSQNSRYIATVHRRGYRIVCPVERIRTGPLAAPEKWADTIGARARSIQMPAFGKWLGAAGAVGLLAALLFLRSEPPVAPYDVATDSDRNQQRVVVALGPFPSQDMVPEWIAPAGLELISRLLASDERVLILRGERLGLDSHASGARWQHAAQDLLGAPLAITGAWRSSDGQNLQLDFNLIELASGRLVHGGY